MSGHSHWKTVKRAKGAADAQKGRIFSKMGRLISVAARQGAEPEENPKLREAIEKAREFNMPSANVERAVKRGSGETGEGQLQEISFEAYGPGNIAIIIEGITDNKNRAIAEIKQILSKSKGKLASEGSVRWLFERKGTIIVNFKDQMVDFKDKEEIELKAIDAGAEDLFWRGDSLEIYTKVEALERVKEKLKAQEIKIESVSLDWVAKEEIAIPEKEAEAAEKLFESLDESDEVQEIYSNLAS